MSRITNVIVTLDILDHRFVIDRLNTWLRLGDHSPLLKVDDHCGRWAFEAHVYMGAFNYFNINRFIELCKLIKENTNFTIYILVWLLLIQRIVIILLK